MNFFASHLTFRATLCARLRASRRYRHPLRIKEITMKGVKVRPLNERGKVKVEWGAI